MSIESELLSLKSTLDRLVKQRDQAQWEVETLQKELKSKYGCGTLEEAEAMAAGLEMEALTLQQELETSVADIRHMYSDLLRMSNG